MNAYGTDCSMWQILIPGSESSPRPLPEAFLFSFHSLFLLPRFLPHAFHSSLLSLSFGSNESGYVAFLELKPQEAAAPSLIYHIEET